MPLDPRPTTLAVIGAGVRGTQLLLQLGRLLPVDGAPLDLHVVDPYPPGAGRTWRTDQPDELLMNGPTESVSAFSLGQGPDLVTWLDERRAPGEPSRRGVFPSRNVYGRYLEWGFEQALATLPARVSVHLHRAWARRARPLADGSLAVVLERESGAPVEVRADVVVLALGWLEAESRDGVVGGLPAGATWIAPGHPAEQPLASIPDGADVLARGLGMGFFDALSLLTLGRGGRFERAGTDVDAAFTYVPSGREPRIHVGSRRGVPFRSKVVAGLTGPSEHPALAEVLRSGSGPLSAADRLVERALADARSAFAARGGDPAELTFDGLENPLAGRTWGTWQEVHDAVVRELELDVAQVRLGVASALKAAHRSVGAARKLLAPVIEARGIEASAWPEYQRILRVGAMLAGGPPPERAEQLLALVRAGVVRFIGPGTAVVADDAGGLRARSPHVTAGRAEGTDGGEAPRAQVLLDAWMHAPDLAGTADPLLRSLLDVGWVRPHRVHGGARLVSGGLDVDPVTGEVLDAAGARQPRLLALGIPTEGARAFTILSPFPGLDERAIDECRRAAEHLVPLLT